MKYLPIIVYFLTNRYLERRRDLQGSVESNTIVDGTEKIRSMIDITYTMKNSDIFGKLFSFVCSCGMYSKYIYKVKLYRY